MTTKSRTRRRLTVRHDTFTADRCFFCNEGFSGQTYVRLPGFTPASLVTPVAHLGCLRDEVLSIPVSCPCDMGSREKEFESIREAARRGRNVILEKLR